MMTALAVVVAVVAATAVYDVVQRRHSILRSFPVIGHLRFLLEAVGPELRQYIVTDNDSERPFSRDERRWVYATAKDQNAYFGFGTDNRLDQVTGYVVFRHAAFPSPPPLALDELPSAKVCGRAGHRTHAFRPASIVNVSAMSFGALSGRAVEALDRGAALAGCLHNTGEGGISPHHRHGADLVWQIGTGYFGCRDDAGRLDLARLVDTAAGAPVRAIEIKLSQGAKPGLGGVLPGSKVTPEIAAIRGVEPGRDCVSPPSHSAFGSVDELLDLVETIAAATGLPVGIKSAVGEQRFWSELATRMATTGRRLDFVTIDGGEGGTGAAPLVFVDHVSLPFFQGFPRVWLTFADAGLTDDVVFIGSGKLGLPARAVLALALGCDLVNVAREPMLALGCIQSQRCHTDRCPVGVATQSAWRGRALDPGDKACRVDRYFRGLRTEIGKVTRACGASHPALLGLDAIEFLEGGLAPVPAATVFGYPCGAAVPHGADVSELLGGSSA